MKRKMLLALVAAMTVSMATPVFAAPSIGQYVEKTVTVTTGLTGNQTLTVKEADASIYTDQKVKEDVAELADASKKVDMTQILTDLGVDTTKPVTTESGTEVTPALYERLAPAFNLVISDADKETYETTGKITATLTVEAAKGKNKEDLLIMVIDPKTGKATFVNVDDLDPETGKITATFSVLGTVVILEKAPIVATTVDSSKCENDKVKEAVEQYKDQAEGVAVADIFGAAGVEGTTVKDQDGNDIDVSEYKTVGNLVDVAMKQGDEYITNVDSQFDGTVQMGLDQVDFKAILKSAGIDFDENASDEEIAESLLDQEEFEAPDYALAQMSTSADGGASMTTGLKFAFEKPEGSDTAVLTIKGKFNGLGPAVLASKAQ